MPPIKIHSKARSCHIRTNVTGFFLIPVGKIKMFLFCRLKGLEFYIATMKMALSAKIAALV
jgi:hypothetical protein